MLFLSCVRMSAFVQIALYLDAPYATHAVICFAAGEGPRHGVGQELKNMKKSFKMDLEVAPVFARLGVKARDLDVGVQSLDLKEDAVPARAVGHARQ